MEEFSSRPTRHQVPRGTRADAEQGLKLYLIKQVSSLGATYQVRLLAYRASREGKTLTLRLPRSCKLRPSLQRLRDEHPELILIEHLRSE